MMSQTPLLSVKELSAGYGREKVIADITFSLKAGEILCLAGESGCGKSTLIKALHAATPGVMVHSGTITLEGTDLRALSPRERQRLCSKKIGLVFQNPGSAFNPIRSYRRQFIETLKSHGKYDPSAFEDQTASAFGKLGLKDTGRILKSCPYEMSGGMNQRIALALALLLEQKILFADEPTSALDATIQRRVADELRRLRDEEGISQIIVTHNLALAQYVADRIGVMYAGRLVELGKADEVIRHPRHCYTQCLLEAVPRLDGEMPASFPGQPPRGGAKEEGCAFFERCPKRCETCSSLGYRFLETDEDHFSSCILWNGGLS